MILGWSKLGTRSILWCTVPYVPFHWVLTPSSFRGPTFVECILWVFVFSDFVKQLPLQPSPDSPMKYFEIPNLEMEDVVSMSKSCWGGRGISCGDTLLQTHGAAPALEWRAQLEALLFLLWHCRPMRGMKTLCTPCVLRVSEEQALILLGARCGGGQIWLSDLLCWKNRHKWMLLMGVA